MRVEMRGKRIEGLLAGVPSRASQAARCASPVKKPCR
jgi:hypothetical protein